MPSSRPVDGTRLVQHWAHYAQVIPPSQPSLLAVLLAPFACKAFLHVCCTTWLKYIRMGSTPSATHRHAMYVCLPVRPSTAPSKLNGPPTFFATWVKMASSSSPVHDSRLTAALPEVGDAVLESALEVSVFGFRSWLSESGSSLVFMFVSVW